MRVGFIGLGNVGAKLAGTLLRNGYELTVRDLDAERVQPFLDRGAQSAQSPREMARSVDLVITCLPSPAISAQVLEGPDGVLEGLSSGKIWLEMSTTDRAEVIRLGAKVEARGAELMDCPVSGGCHRAATGNIAIFAGGRRETFERVLPVLTTLGRRILHTGPLGSASTLKVVTNYLCTVHLAALAEALSVSKAAGMDMNVAYEAIRISSGNSFVHETESQVILNGSRNINFTMDLVIKDVGLFDRLAREHGIPLEISPLVLEIFRDGQARYGPREHSPNIIRRLEEACDIKVLGEGFPAEIVDDEPEAQGYEVRPDRASRPSI
jgi:3-hydroxyisobutyrate dehydrogenase